MPDSVRPHGLQPTRLLRPWDFPGKSTGVGCHCLLQKKTPTIPQFKMLWRALCRDLDPTAQLCLFLESSVTSRELCWPRENSPNCLPRSDQNSRSVVWDSLRPHELQHARPPCPSPTPGVHPDSCPSSQ